MLEWKKMARVVKKGAVKLEKCILETGKQEEIDTEELKINGMQICRVQKDNSGTVKAVRNSSMWLPMDSLCFDKGLMPGEQRVVVRLKAVSGRITSSELNV